MVFILGFYRCEQSHMAHKNWETFSSNLNGFLEIGLGHTLKIKLVS